MKLPSKVTPYSKSTLAKLPVGLKRLDGQDLRPLTLYQKVHTHFEDVNDFVDTLDCLYALGAIELLYPEEVLHYVGRVR